MLGWKGVRRPGGASGWGSQGVNQCRPGDMQGGQGAFPNKGLAANENGGLAPKAQATKANRTGNSDLREIKTSFMHQKTAERVKCNTHEERKYLQSGI